MKWKSNEFIRLFSDEFNYEKNLEIVGIELPIYWKKKFDVNDFFLKSHWKIESLKTRVRRNINNGNVSRREKI